MTLHHPMFLLLLLLLPVAWRYWRSTPGSSRLSFLLKCAASAGLVIALADPWLWLPVRKLAVTMVLDTSASMSKESVLKGESLFHDLVRKNWGAELRLITVSDRSHLYSETQGNPASPAASSSTPGVEPVSDLESGLQLALSTLPQPGAGRVLLYSDGQENRGHALNAALRARQVGVPVFVVPAADSPNPRVEVQSIRMPQQAFSGERFTVSLVLDSPRAFPAQIFVTCQGHQIGGASVRLQSGTNPINMEMRIQGQGITLAEVHIRTGDSEHLLVARAITIHRPRVLYVSGADRPSEALLKTLKDADVDAEVRSELPAQLQNKDWDSVVLDDVAGRQLPPAAVENVQSYVRAGGGLVVIAGENTPQLLQFRTSFERVLPVRGAPEKPDNSMTVVLVLDRSGSMAGLKIQKAREAARASLLTLRPTDRIGIIAFNDQFRWVAPLQTVSDVSKLTRLIDSIAADGSTKIYPPLKAAFDAVLGEKTSQKHIIVLTDGVSEQEALPQLMLDAAAHNVTISTIGLGNDVLRGLLEKLAQTTHGRSYFVSAESDLPQIMSGEILNAKASAIKEGPVQVVGDQPAEITDGIDFSKAPPLLGFVRSKAKDGAETILRVKSGEPLLVRWRYGLGQVVAFLSDARGKWAANWVEWEPYGKLWPQLVRSLTNRDRRVHVTTRPGSADGEQIVAYDLLGGVAGETGGALNAAGRPMVLVQSPGDVVQSVPLVETTPDHYEARIRALGPGLYRVFSPPNVQRDLPEVGFYRQSEESEGRGGNRELLARIAETSGGRLSPSVDQLLDRRGTLAFEPRPIWPYILIAVLFLNFFEVALRRGLLQRPRRMAGQDEPPGAQHDVEPFNSHSMMAGAGEAHFQK
jgi:Ca-activated chloride channel homolog